MSNDLVKRLRANNPLTREYLITDEAADRIQQLEAALQRSNANVEEYERKFYLGTDRIEKLEAALREIAGARPECCCISDAMQGIARKALEGKDG